MTALPSKICFVDIETTGMSLRNDLFTEMNKLFNIAMYVDFSGDVPQLIIDKYENIFTNTNQLTISNVKDVKLKFEKEEFYTKVN